MAAFVLSATVALDAAICAVLSTLRTSPSAPDTTPFVANWQSTNNGLSNVSPYVSTTLIKASNTFLYALLLWYLVCHILRYLIFVLALAVVLTENAAGE